MDSVAEIATLVSPPKTVTAPASNELNESLAKRISLPDDYIRFLTVFGCGSFANKRFELGVFDLVSLPTLNEKTAFEVLYQFPHEVGDEIIASYPETPGFMPWGRDDQGTTFYWIVDGHPNEWKTAVGRLTHKVYDENMSQLLLRCIRATIPFYDDEPFSFSILHTVMGDDKRMNRSRECRL